MFDWRRPLVYTHRWLGIAIGLLFVAWFASGLVLMYAPMPSLSTADRLAAAPPVDFTRALVPPAAAAPAVGGAPERVRIGMVGDRPVYRFLHRGQWTTVFADTGGAAPPMEPGDVGAIVRRFAPAHAATLRHDAYLADADQWTFSVRGLMPMHRVTLGDPSDTHVYVSDRTLEPVMVTNAASRRWGYAGAVLHWLYFAPLRREAAVWSQLVIWLSIAGCVLVVSGLVWGVWRLPGRSPYSGLLKWHHYAGLIFGLTTFTWVFSGLLSMEPWSWSPSTAPTREQRAIMSGGPLRFDLIALDTIRAAAASQRTAVKELEVVQFRGKPFFVTGDGTVIDHDSRGGISPRQLLDAALQAMPGVNVTDWATLDRYDAYYYSRASTLPLPVLRVRFDDPSRTWLYLDPARGTIARKEVRVSRVNRWLYHGFHSLDFPFLYYRRPLWDIVMVVLSIGGLVISATTLMPGWKRMYRKIKG